MFFSEYKQGFLLGGDTYGWNCRVTIAVIVYVQALVCNAKTLLQVIEPIYIPMYERVQLLHILDNAW